MSVFTSIDNMRESSIGRYVGETFDNIATVSNEMGVRDITGAAVFGGALAVTLVINDFIGVGLGRSLVGGTAGTTTGLLVAHAATIGMIHLFNKCVSRVRSY